MTERPRALPELLQTFPKLSQGLPELRQSFPELTQISTASQCRRSYRVMFFYFLMDVSAKTLTFESISGRKSSQKVIKSRCFR